MKKYKLLLPLFLLICLSSCQTLMSSIVGIKEPTAKNDDEIKKYAKSKYPDFPIYRIGEASMDSILRTEYKPGWSPEFKPIQFICFNQDGKVVTQWASCEAGLKSYTLDTFPPKSKYPSSPELSIQKIIKISKVLTPEKATLSDYSKYNYTYVLYFCSWTEKLSSNTIKTVADYAASHSSSYNIVLVNIDFYKLPPSLLK